MRVAALTILVVALAACGLALDADSEGHFDADILVRSHGRIDFFLQDAEAPCAGEDADRWTLFYDGRRWSATAPPATPVEALPEMPFRGGLVHRLDPVSLSFHADDGSDDVLQAELGLTWHGGPFVWPDP